MGLFDDDPILHAQNAVCDISDADIVGNDQHRRGKLPVYPVECFEHTNARLAVQGIKTAIVTAKINYSGGKGR